MDAREQLRSVIDDAVETIKGVDIGGKDESLTLTELDIDSLDVIEIGMIIEDRLQFEIDSESLAGAEGLERLGNLLDLLEPQLRAATGE